MISDSLRALEIPKLATFATGNGGLPVLDITSPHGRARIYLLGAHVAEWVPAGQQPVLFMSEKSHFAVGKPIRGGVPVCFPWFAARANHPQSPAHGFVRQAEWSVESIVQEADDSVTATFAITDSPEMREQWPHAFTVKHRVKVGQTLEMTLEVTNPGPEPFTFEEALHTYFTVSAVQGVEVRGLEGAEYIDKVKAFERLRQPADPIWFTGETDRIFPGTTSTCTLHDPGLKREIVVEKSGSNTTVVWNPWIAKAAAMPDFGDGEWPGMVCIETANAGENSITLPPGQTHTMTARISVR